VNEVKKDFGVVAE